MRFDNWKDVDRDPLRGMCCKHTDGNKDFVYAVLQSPAERDSANPPLSKCVCAFACLFGLLNVGCAPLPETVASTSILSNRLSKKKKNKKKNNCWLVVFQRCSVECVGASTNMAPSLSNLKHQRLGEKPFDTHCTQYTTLFLGSLKADA